MNKLELLRRSHFSQEVPMKYDIPPELEERCNKLHVLLDWKQCPTQKNNIDKCRFVWKPIEALLIECEHRESKKKTKVHYLKKEPDFETIQKKIGGYFTIVIIDDNKQMYIREDGELVKLQINKKASDIIGYNIYGDVIIVG